MYNNGRLYGNRSAGFGYSPRDYVVKDPTAHNTQFFGASGSKQGGYYYSPDRSYDVDRYNPSTRKSYPCADLLG